MASIFGHVAASTALGYAFFPKKVRALTLVAAGFCAFAPDLDVLAFRYGIDYQSEWGHRGWTHSLVFAVLLGVLAALFFRAKDATAPREMPWKNLSAWFVLSVVSHPLLDMMTNGGRGCALWWPFSTERIFFSWRPIQVSPLTVADFFTPWGLEVLASEVLWIGFPCVAIVWMAKLYRSRFQPVG